MFVLFPYKTFFECCLLLFRIKGGKRSDMTYDLSWFKLFISAVDGIIVECDRGRQKWPLTAPPTAMRYITEYKIMKVKNQKCTFNEMIFHYSFICTSLFNFSRYIEIIHLFILHVRKRDEVPCRCSAMCRCSTQVVLLLYSECSPGTDSGSLTRIKLNSPVWGKKNRVCAVPDLSTRWSNRQINDNVFWNFQWLLKAKELNL